MKAWAVVDPGPLDAHPLRRLELPVEEPGPGQVRLRIAACGVCRTDLHEAEGEIGMPRLPVVPGHEAVGVVEAAGPESSLAPGARVGVGWLHRACGRCEYCRSGLENLCDRAIFTGLDVDGGYAETMLARADFCLPLPADIDDVHAAPLLCSGIIGYRALTLAGARPGAAVGLFGFGGSAHIALQILKHRGCRVSVFTRGAARRRLAERLGADWAGPLEERGPAALDGAVSFAPAGDVIPLALARLKKGGILALAGIHIDRIPEMPYRLLFEERTLRSVTAATRRDGVELLELAARIPIRVEAAAFPFDRANEALAALKSGGLEGAAVLSGWETPFHLRDK